MAFERFRAEFLRVQQDHPDVELYLAWTGPSEPIVLHVLRTLPVRRGRGLADAALRDVIAAADRLRVPIRLTVESITGDADTDPARLIAWYRRYAFRAIDRPGDTHGQIMQRPVGGHPREK